MDDNTLLIKIEEIMDRKLDEKLDQKLDEKLDLKLQPIYDRLTGVEDRLTGVEDRQTGVEVRLTGVEDRLTGVEDRQTSMEEDLTSVKKTCFRVENELIPQLNALYEDRIPHAEFRRLSEQVEQNTRMLSVMKDVIISHSEEIRCVKEVK